MESAGGEGSFLLFYINMDQRGIIVTFTSNGPSTAGSRIGGLLVAISGLATAIIQGFVTKTAWIFGVAPGFSMVGRNIGTFVRISGLIVGLIWFAVGVLMAVIAVKRLTLVVTVALVAAVLFLLAPGVEYMSAFMHWTMVRSQIAPVTLMMLLPVAITIGLALSLWLGRSPGLALKAVTMVVLSVAVLLAVGCATGILNASPMWWPLWCYYLLTSGMFTTGWVVMMATVSQSKALQNSSDDV